MTKDETLMLLKRAFDALETLGEASDSDVSPDVWQKVKGNDLVFSLEQAIKRGELND